MLKKRPLWIALGVILLVRVLLAMSRMDEVELELYGGSLAHAILHGMPLDPTQLPIIVHLRGSVLMALLLMPFFAVFGPNLWAFKLLAVAWTLASAWLLMLALERSLGRRAAVVGGLVYAFLPPAFQMVDVTLLGSHGETILFIALGLLFVVRQQQGLLERRRGLLAFGAICGLGFLFSMQFLTVIPALIAAWWAQERRLGSGAQALKQSLVIGTPALLLCALYLAKLGPRFADVLPMWWQFALVGAVMVALGLAVRPLRILLMLGGLFLVASPTPWLTRSTKVVTQSLESRILPRGLGGAASKFGQAVSHQFADSWLFDVFGGPLAKWLFGLAVLAGLLATLRRLWRLDSLAIFAFLQPLFFLCLYAVTNLKMDNSAPLDGMGSRYMMPVMASVTIWIAILFHDLYAGRRRLLAAAAVLAPVTAGALGLVPLLEPSIAFGQPAPRGTRFHFFQAHLNHAGGEDLGKRLEWIERVDDQWAAFRPGYYRSVLFSRAPGEATLRGFLGVLEQALESERPLRDYLMFDLGYRGFEMGLVRDRGAMASILERIGEDNQPWFMRGMGASGVTWALFNRVGVGKVKGGGFKDFKFLAAIPKQLRGYAAQGAGFVTGDNLTAFNRVPIENVELAEAQLEGRDLENFFVGVALGVRTHYIEDSWWVPEPGALRVERMLSPEAQVGFREGLEAPRESFPAPQ